MNGVGVAHPPFVVALFALSRKLLPLDAVHLREGANHRISLNKQFRVSGSLKQPPPHNFEALFGTGRTPRRLDPPDRILEPIDRFFAAIAANLDIRRWDAHHQQRVFGVFGRLAQGLGKGKLGLKTAPRDVALLMELSRVRHPLINQNQAGGESVKQQFERIAGVGGGFIGMTHHFIAISTAQLPCQLTPEGFYYRPLLALMFWFIRHNAAGL